MGISGITRGLLAIWKFSRAAKGFPRRFRLPSPRARRESKFNRARARALHSNGPAGVFDFPRYPPRAERILLDRFRLFRFSKQRGCRARKLAPAAYLGNAASNVFELPP